ncbi:MAG: hypothetical protein O3C43_15945 [Verrucomicrobia bacterium]|nr:hypothetical protein [Verrucomicrobiota bacterium]MDA1067984.1 hypothetical protein [Verrucomicrobiota bacterium]
MKQLPDDFSEFLSFLNEKQVEYLVVGGWALGVHGYVKATGVEFIECYPRRMEIVLDNLPIPVISYDDFVLNKRASGRLKDKVDLESLGEEIE